MSKPAIVGGSRRDAVFQSEVPPHETTTPRTAVPRISVTTALDPSTEGTTSWPVAQASGRAARESMPVATPTIVDHAAGDTLRCSVRKRVFAIPYQVQSATAPEAAAGPANLRPVGA